MELSRTGYQQSAVLLGMIHMGDLIGAFWEKIDSTSIDFAEMEAIVRGIRLCRSMGIGVFQIETDSIAVFKAAKENSNNPALIYMARKNAIGEHNIDHIHREENIVADLLAKASRSNDDKTFQLYSQLPTDIRKAIYLDKIGVPSYRKGKKNYTGVLG
ncbi:hypothetical protein CASFOL_026969 [Castilleja foliolosa]|uniref:RNase H type-1 domain-containing protein n=1 Tax=Castilleja foliolosa TaxID=1961234 RepID=A0ABD3CMC2_9LAMI